METRNPEAPDANWLPRSFDRLDSGPVLRLHREETFDEVSRQFLLEQHVKDMRTILKVESNVSSVVLMLLVYVLQDCFRQMAKLFLEILK